jgi:acyl-CoA reductase-like NAD-dependent aldehyde dehydrogenase
MEIIVFPTQKMSYSVLSPSSNQLYKKFIYQSKSEALAMINKSKIAQKEWKKSLLVDRQRILSKFIENFAADKAGIATELAYSVGKPLYQGENEVVGFISRGAKLIEKSTDYLAPIVVERNSKFERFTQREPLGVTLIIIAWNYPLLLIASGIIPGLLAGNSVILKLAPQNFGLGTRLIEAMKAAGMPRDVFQVLQADLDVVGECIQHKDISYVQFTGSVRGGNEVNKLANARIVHTAFEMGGKDPAYVREDADPMTVAQNLIDGAMYNSGQSCCAVERIYVHEKVYDSFVQHAVEAARSYKVSDPLDSSKGYLGPVISSGAANNIREQVKEAVVKGAKCLIDESLFPLAQPGSAYVAPQILVNVDHSMKIMQEETFGPVVGIMKVIYL